MNPSLHAAHFHKKIEQGLSIVYCVEALMSAASRTLKLSEVPSYLREGELYRTLITNQNENVADAVDDEIVVPGECLKPGPWVKSSQDAKELLNTLRYWMVPNLPYQLYNFAFSFSANFNDMAGFNAAVEPFLTEFKQLQTLLAVRREWCRDQQLAAAIKCGDMNLLKYLWEDTERHWTNDECVVAAELGNLEALQYAHTHGCDWFNPLKMKVALPNASCFATGTVFHHCACYAALRRSHLPCYQYARTHGCICEYNTRVGVCNDWTPECLAYVMREDLLSDQPAQPGFNRTKAKEWSNEALSTDSLMILQNLNDLGWRADAACVHYILSDCSAEMLAFVVRHDGELLGCEVTHLVELGRPDELLPLFERGLQLSSDDVGQILEQTHRDGKALLAEAITRNYCTKDPDTLLALFGQDTEHPPYELLELAFTHGFERSEKLCVFAVCESDLELLQFAHRHGCPLTEVVYAVAAYKSELPCLRYAVESGSAPLTAAMVRAARRAPTADCLDYLISQGCPTNDLAGLVLESLVLLSMSLP